ncbi:uncharacterized protein LOC132746839 [Ruditapes philippinarum]|uniref:uncharacterized protein LOC132746839 n=1 Tax=Ruditapes philippinarum TaxID=129788 RepID=UPI00295AF0C0|nr:uncharacterized protein LOC132746839 [Ruditapes philippinarum]
MSSVEDKNLSLAICSTLDYLGFSKEQIVYRAEHMDKVSQIYTNASSLGSVLIVGSRGEGVGLSDSDTDIMKIFKHVICVDESFADGDLIVLRADYTNTEPGYIKVEGKNMYISNKGVKDRLIESAIPPNLSDLNFNFNLTGPAIHFFACDIDTDYVYCTSFYGGNYLSRWTNRTRNYAWPPRKVRHEVSQMEGYIVPIGSKQGDMQEYEWRICYTTAEKKLVSSLSDIQVKAYVLLKIMAKTLLKPKCKFLTSYVIKNVIFWVMEMTHFGQLSPSHIVYLIQKAIFFIKNCITNNHLPNYMIPERNLLKGAVLGKEKEGVINFLSDCLEQGGSILLQIPKLYTCISLTISKPDLFLAFRKWRNEAERSVFVFAYDATKSLHNVDINTSKTFDNIIQEAKKNVAFEARFNFVNILLPDLFSLLLSGKSMDDIRQIVNERSKLLDFL